MKNFITNATRHTPLEIFGLQAKKGQFGLELELEGQGFPDAPPGWTVHNDGSILGGLEYVTSTPHNVDGVIDRVRTLNDAFQRAGSVVNNSHRTSTHIHFNVQRSNYLNILGMVTAFATVEPLFLRLCGPDRDGNLFCLSSYDTGELPDYFSKMCRRIANGDWLGMGHRGKYSSLNIDTISRFGSLEFRCFPATLDVDKIVSWCRWIENLQRLVHTCADRSFFSLYLRCKQEPLEVAREIFGPVDLPERTIRELMMFGCHTGYELSRQLRSYVSDKEEEEGEF